MGNAFSRGFTQQIDTGMTWYDQEIDDFTMFHKSKVKYAWTRFFQHLKYIGMGWYLSEFQAVITTDWLVIWLASTNSFGAPQLWPTPKISRNLTPKNCHDSQQRAYLHFKLFKMHWTLEGGSTMFDWFYHVLSCFIPALSMEPSLTRSCCAVLNPASGSFSGTFASTKCR